jgi:proton-dependent oligopeptide transporter, POT family
VGLTYLTPVAGGWLADRFLGTKRCLGIGGVILALGYLALAIGPGVPFYSGLLLIVLGTGFFKSNMHTIVGQLYRVHDSRRDSGFTLYYMGINVGAFLGPLACAGLAARFGWHYGFAASGVAMLIALGFFSWAQGERLRGVGLAPPRRASGATEPRAGPLSAPERRCIGAIAIITLFVVAFWLAFEQAGSSLNVFAAHRTDRAASWVGWIVPNGAIPAAWFQSINPLCILLLAPAVAGFWQRLGPRAPGSPAKMALGLLLLAIAYVVMVIGAAAGDGGSRVSPWYLVLFYLIYSLGELCFLPVGISFVSQTAPARLASMLMGIWLTANFIANLIGGYLAGMVERVERGELFRVFGGQADFFLIFVVLCLSAAGLLWLLVPTVNRLAHGAERP